MRPLSLLALLCLLLSPLSQAAETAAAPLPQRPCGEYEVTGTWVRRTEGAYLYVFSNRPEETELTLSPATPRTPQPQDDSLKVTLRGTLTQPIEALQGRFTFSGFTPVRVKSKDPAAGDGFRLIRKGQCRKQRD